LTYYYDDKLEQLGAIRLTASSCLDPGSATAWNACMDWIA